MADEAQETRVHGKLYATTQIKWFKNPKTDKLILKQLWRDTLSTYEIWLKVPIQMESEPTPQK